MKKKYAELEKFFEKQKGYKFVKKDDLLKKAENTKKKKEQCNKYHKILNMIKDESLILDNTINILKKKSSNYDQIIKKLEEKHGVTGFLSAKKELEKLSKQKEEVDMDKAKTLEEYSNLIMNLKKKIQETERLHAPTIEKRNKIKQEHTSLMQVYEQKKKNYLNHISDVKGKYDKTKEQLSSLEKDLKVTQDNYFQLNITLSITENMISRYEKENAYVNRSDRLNEKYKSFSEYYRSMMSSQESFIKDLRESSRNVKEIVEDNLRQAKWFSELKEMLAVKKSTI